MSKKIKIEVDFGIGDRVCFVSEEEEMPTPAFVTKIILTDSQATYIVSRGFEEKECYSFELVAAEVTK